MQRKIISISIAFLLCFSVSLVGVAAELETKTAIVHSQPNPIFALVSVAIEKGWFQDEGFEKVETKSFTAGALAGEALIAGEIQVWLPGNMPVISMRHNGIPVVVVGTLNAAAAEWLLVRNDAGVEKPEDLYNIEIGLLVGSTASGVLDNLAAHYGLDPNKLKVKNLAPPEQLTSLKNNEIQAMVVWPPFALRAKDFATYMFNSLDFSSTVMPVVYSEDFIRDKPNTAKALLKVLLKGQEFCKDPANKAEAIKIHAKISEQSEEIVEEGWDAFWDSKYPHGIVDEAFLKKFENYTEFQVKNGRIKDPINIRDYLYTDFLEEVKPEYLKDVKGNWKP